MKLKFAFSLALFLLIIGIESNAQQEAKREPKVVETQRITTKNPEVAKLKEALNVKSKAKTKSNNPNTQQGPVYGPDYCDVVIDNYTDLYIKVWVDDEYKGIVSPYGKITVDAIPGKTKLYARADYTDGSYAYWNPPAFDCSWQYTWRLR